MPTQFVIDFQLLPGRYQTTRNLNIGLLQSALKGAQAEAHFFCQLFFVSGLD